MSIHNYLIDHRNLDWPSLLREWKWLVPGTFTVWMMNRFGDLFIVLEDGTIRMLDIGGGTLIKVADSRDEFAAKVDEDNANQWFMIPLIDHLIAHGLTLQEGQCYSFRRPPVLGGNYTVENTCVLPISAHYSAYGSIHNQIKDLPDGTQVVINPKK
jgi:hypothetical protein